MSANGATKRDLFRVIREKDALIMRLYDRIWALEKERADDQRPIGGALPQVARGASWAESTASLAPIDAEATSPAQTGLAAVTAGAENEPLHDAEDNSAPRI